MTSTITATVTGINYNNNSNPTPMGPGSIGSTVTEPGTSTVTLVLGNPIVLSGAIAATNATVDGFTINIRNQPNALPIMPGSTVTISF